MDHMKQDQQGDDLDKLGTETIPITGGSEALLTEEELLADQEKFNQSTSSVEGIIIHDKVKILDANHTLATMFGYELSEVIGLTVLQLITQDTRGVILKNILLKQQKPYEAIGLRKDGTTFPIQIQNRMMLYQEQLSKAMVIQEIAEHKQAEILDVLHQTKANLEEQVKQNTLELRVANERLQQELDERNRMETEITQYNLGIFALQSAGAAITSSLDLQQVLNTVTQEMTKLLEAETCTIYEWDQPADTISLSSQYDYTAGWDVNAAGKVFFLIDHPLKKLVLTEKRTQQISLNQPHLDPTELAYIQKANIKASLLHSMIFRERVIGLVEIQYQNERTFGEHEISLAQLLTNQAASAIENARLYAETQQHADKLTVLRELDRAITTSLRVSDIYHALAHHAVRLLPCSRMSITLLEEDAIRIAYVSGDDKEQTALPVGTLLPYQTSNIGWVIERNQPSLHHNIVANPHFVENEKWLAEGLQSIMLVPLRVMGQVIGTWNLGSTEIGAYTPDDLEIAQSIADQLAIAMENARLFKQAQQEISERQRVEAVLQEERSLLAQRVEERTAELQQQYQRQATLAEIELAINQPHELQHLLDYIAQTTEQTLEANGGAVVLLNADSETFLIHSTFIPNQELQQIVERMQHEDEATHWIIDNRQPLTVSDISQASFDLVPVLLEDEHTAYAGVPLLAKEDVLGVLYVFDQESRQYTEEDLDFMMAIANRAAVAITKVRLYEQLERANVELARAARLKDEFLAAMSHELRTPLAAILGISELLKEEVYGPINERQVSSVQSIEDSGRHLLTLINDILDLSKIEAGKLELQIDPVPIERVCQASLDFVRQTAQKKRLKISSSYDNSITVLRLDERRLKQILVNLLSNAVKFTPEGGEIGLNVTGDLIQQLVHFTVWDTGVGIAPEDMERLFHPFVQLDSSLSRHYTGTGLGLALVQRMTQMQGGRVSVESKVGEGSRFTVSLPWFELLDEGRQNAAKSQQTQHAAPASLGSDNIEILRASNERPLILVAEDEEKISQLLSDYLLDNDYRVVVAKNGVEAIEQAKTQKPDLILMDVYMPEMNGLEATRRLREDPDLEAIPIIALTALAMRGDREQCLEAGANDYLSKPVRLNQLIKLVKMQLKQDQTTKEI